MSRLSAFASWTVVALGLLVCGYGALRDSPRAAAAGGAAIPATTPTQMPATRPRDAKPLRVGIVILRSLDDPEVILGDAKKYPDRDYVNDRVNQWLAEFPRKVGNREVQVCAVEIGQGPPAFEGLDLVVLMPMWAYRGWMTAELDVHANTFHDFIKQGGGVLVFQPNPMDNYPRNAPVGDFVSRGLQRDGYSTPALLPLSATFYNRYVNRDIVIKTADLHPITQGLTDAQMPSASDQIPALAKEYTVLARGQSSDSPSLAVGAFGKGRVVLVADNVGGSSGRDQPCDVVVRSILWACRCGDDEVAAAHGDSAAFLAASAMVPAYRGFLRQLREADTVILVKNEEVTEDPATRLYQVAGTVSEVYKGAAKAGDRVRLDVNYPAIGHTQELGNQETRVPFFTTPKNGETQVYLLKDAQVLGITCSRHMVADYARISTLKTDAEAGLELLRLYGQMNLIEHETSATENPYFLLKDIKCYYPAVDVKSEAFGKMLAGFRNALFDQLLEKKITDTPTLLLASHLPEVDRRKLVESMLVQYDREKEVRLGNPQQWGSAVWLLVDTSWHETLSVADASFWLLPYKILERDPLANPENLAAARKFATGSGQ